MPLVSVLSLFGGGATPTPPTPPTVAPLPPPGYTPPLLPSVAQQFNSPQIGNVEVALTYGADLLIDATGDLVLTFDAPGNPAATQQRLQRLILQAPILYDASNNPISYPDDVFNPNRGAGISVEVGEPITPALLSGIKSRVLAALSTDPGVAQTPAPTVNVTNLGGGMVQLDISVQTIYGQIVTLPALSLGG